MNELEACTHSAAALLLLTCFTAAFTTAEVGGVECGHVSAPRMHYRPSETRMPLVVVKCSTKMQLDTCVLLYFTTAKVHFTAASALSNEGACGIFVHKQSKDLRNKAACAMPT
jgi:hypothetical protein